MRAVVQDRYGPVDEVLHLREVPVPEVAADEVLVRVRASSVHPDVWHAVTGRPYVLRLMGSGVRRPRYHTPGTDLGGRWKRLGAA
jgi:NADPH:quinone reductase-like Zn-dependent oxidoreductase